MSAHTPGEWWPMGDGPLRDDLWVPWTAFGEAAGGITIGSTEHTEPICRVSGYLQPVIDNARLIAVSPRMDDYIAKRANEGDTDAAEILAAI